MAGAVLDDIALARAVRRGGRPHRHRRRVALAACRMYEDGRELSAGYEKSLWSAFGPPGAPGGGRALRWCTSCRRSRPLAGSRIGLAGYAAAVAGRRRRAPPAPVAGWPDALAHPLSVAALLGLLALVVAGTGRGTLRWKGRPLR